MATLPPWMRNPGAGDTEEFRNWVPPPCGAVVDRKAVHLAEAKRMRENKMYRFAFFEETEDININVRPQYETEARTTEVNETAKLEELSEIHVQKTNSKRSSKRLTTSDLSATVHSVAMEQETNTHRKTCDKGDSQDVDHTSTSGQSEE